MRTIFRHIVFLLSVIACVLSPHVYAAATKHQQHYSPISHHGGHVKKHNKHVTHKASKSKHQAKRKHPPIPNDRTASVEEPVLEQPKLAARSSFGFFKSIEQRFVDHVSDTVNNLRYSAYKLGGSKYDKQRGVYVLDCSTYVDHLIAETFPDAYSRLVDFTGSEKPTSAHYYDFFSDLDNDPRDMWSRVDEVGQLRAGDVLVFRYKNSVGRVTGGHVMVVMDKPTQDDDVYFVRVADSARGGHSEDTRTGRVSGIGIGTLLLRANPRTGQPAAYAWKVGAHWNNNVKIAMGRPVSSSS